jgi:hypothetical protein
MTPDDKRSDLASELPDYVDEPLEAPSFFGGWFSTPERKRFLLWGVILVLLIWLIPTAYRGLKNWRAGIFIGQSEAAFAIGDSNGGITLMKKALALAPGSLRVQHAVQLYNAGIGDKESLAILLFRMRSGDSENDELLGIAELESQAGNLPIAREAISHLPPGLSSEHALRQILIEAAMMAQEGNIAKAAEHCFSSARVLGEENAPYLLTQGALYLISDNEATERRQAVEILLSVVKSHTEASLPAWRVLAPMMLGQPIKPDEAEQSADRQELIKLLPTLPGSTVSDRLLSADLEIQSDPSSRKAVVESLTRQYSLAPRSEMLEFARWLNARRLFREASSFALADGVEKHPGDADWLIILMDARSAQGDWNEVADMLKNSTGAGIPDAVRHLFLARIALINGDQTTAETEWGNLNRDLSLEKTETLAYLANYEERIGAVDQTAKVYREMVKRKETKILGLVALIRCQPITDSVATLIPLYEQLLAASPEFPDAVGDLAYLNLLLDQEIIPSSAKAENLLREQPNLLARISVAALGRLRRGDTKGALSLYDHKEIDWQISPNRWKAVRCAVLRATGNTGEADRIASTIDSSHLRPEELELLKPSENHQ